MTPYQLPTAMYVRLEVFNILGQPVVTTSWTWKGTSVSHQVAAHAGSRAGETAATVGRRSPRRLGWGQSRVHPTIAVRPGVEVKVV